MELNDALRRMARNYPGGLTVLAERMKKPHSTLDKEIRGAAGFKLGLQDAQEAMEFCHDVGAPGALELLQLQAARVGQMLVPLPGVVRAPMTLESLAKLMHECADLVGVVTKAKADGKICDNELRQCQAAWADLMAAGHALMQDLQAQNESTMARWGKDGVR